MRWLLLPALFVAAAALFPHPSLANPEACQNGVCATSTDAKKPDGSHAVHVKLRNIDTFGEFFQVIAPGAPQFEVKLNGSFDFLVGPNQAPSYQVQVCWGGALGHRCNAWAAFTHVLAPDPGAAFCQSYADDAVAQATKNLQMNCGFGGPRWSTNRADHLSWCLALNGEAAPAATEGSYRIVGLKDCAAKVVPPKKIIKSLGKKKPAQQTATVQSDVDVYDAPGGNGNVTGALTAGDTVTLAAACAKDDWCHVVGAAVPNGDGWVWGSVRPPN